MSYKVTEAVLHSSRSRRGSRLVLCALAEVAAHDGTAWSPIGPAGDEDSIAYRAGLSTRQVMRCLQQLELIDELDVREWRQGRKLWNVYRIVVGPIREKPVNYERPELAARNLAEPFWTVEELLIPRAQRPRQTRRLGDILSPSHGPAEAPGEVTSAPVPGDISDRGEVTYATENGVTLRKDPSVGTVIEPTGETKIVSPVAADAAEREGRRFEISLALSAALGVQVGSLTRSERGAWERAVEDLVEVGASSVEVTARCAAYRDRWPDMALTPLALARHWSMLGASIELARPNGFVGWLEHVTELFDRQTAHEVIDDAQHLDAVERASRHELVDGRFDEAERAAA